tara:strand:+ start:2633 stop:3754 length:1122 start_codon:yes stop_codon:yes gene_type:complete
MENVKQEGEFKIKKAPRKLNVKQEITKIDVTAKVIEKEVLDNENLKIVIPKEDEEIKNEIKQEHVIEEIIEREEDKETIEEEERNFVKTQEEKEEEKIIEKQLPDGINKLVTFMEETGGTVEDYVRLNADYSKVDDLTLLKEYYKSTKPYLDNSEVQLIIEDNFDFDEDIDEERDIRKKKLAFKEEIAKAKQYLETVKAKYYEEIKLKPSVSKEQNEAFDFFNRYKKTEQESNTRHERFKKDTKNLFTNDFKGFEFNIGDKKFRYNVPNGDSVAEKQSDINNFIGKFLDKEGNVSDVKGYHKELYAGMNADKIAEHFYEQGKADATKEIIQSSRNPTTTARSAMGDVFINGLKVKSISEGIDSTKLTIKKKIN